MNASAKKEVEGPGLSSKTKDNKKFVVRCTKNDSGHETVIPDFLELYLNTPERRTSLLLIAASYLNRTTVNHKLDTTEKKTSLEQVAVCSQTEQLFTMN